MPKVLETKLKRKARKMKLGKKAPLERGYCNRCGTTLLFRSSRWDDEIHVTLANFEQPIDRTPSPPVFYDSHVKWVQLGDDLECYPETP